VKDNKATFLAMVKSVTIKSLVSGDKSVRIVLDVDNPDADTLQAINNVHQADKQVAVAMAEVVG
jgi:hypothetical protein